MSSLEQLPDQMIEAQRYSLLANRIPEKDFKNKLRPLAGKGKIDRVTVEIELRIAEIAFIMSGIEKDPKFNGTVELLDQELIRLQAPDLYIKNLREEYKSNQTKKTVAVLILLAVATVGGVKGYQHVEHQKQIATEQQAAKEKAAAELNSFNNDIVRIYEETDSESNLPILGTRRDKKLFGTMSEENQILDNGIIQELLKVPTYTQREVLVAEINSHSDKTNGEYWSPTIVGKYIHQITSPTINNN
jgi:hypothetical protein